MKIDYKKEYQKELVNFIGEHLWSQFSEIKIASEDLTLNAGSYLTALRKRFLLHFIVVELYEKEYPFIAEMIYSQFPEIKNLDVITKQIVNALKNVLPNGLLKIGANKIYFNGEDFFYLSPNNDLYSVLPANIVGFPIEFGEQVDNKMTSNEVVFSLVFKEENILASLSEKIFTRLQKGEFDNNYLHKSLGNIFSVNTSRDYDDVFSFLYDELTTQSLPIGLQEAKKLCEEYSLSIIDKIDQKTLSYNQKFLKNFSVEYYKRIQFLSLISIFVNKLDNSDIGVWFLRDQIEPYLLRKCFDKLKDRESQNKLLTISRNSTSSEKEDHYLYIVLNYLYYKSANESDGTYNSFINIFRSALRETESSDSKVSLINKKVLKHCENQGLFKLLKNNSLKIIDTGFQGTFNVYLDALLKNKSDDMNQNIQTSSLLTGIWPWLTGILEKQYVTTYFPAILIIEFFDGIHEFAQYNTTNSSGEPEFKQADLRHQLPTFLDTILIRDVAIVLAKDIDIPNL